MRLYALTSLNGESAKKTVESSSPDYFRPPIFPLPIAGMLKFDPIDSCSDIFWLGNPTVDVSDLKNGMSVYIRSISRKS